MSTTLLDVPTEHYIGGERVPSAARFQTINPYTQEVIAEVSRAGEAEVDRAVRAAYDAFPAWAALGVTARAAHLHRLADLIDANVERLAAVESADMAMLLRSLRARVIARGALNYRNYADLAVAYEERDWRSKGTWNRVQRMPAGPAAPSAAHAGKASCAARTARSTSASPARETSAITSCV